MSESTFEDGDLVAGDDTEVLQAVVIAAAISGNAAARTRLSTLIDAFEEPYRTVAAVVRRKLSAGEFIDRMTLGTVLASHRLIRQSGQGVAQELSVGQVVGLVFNATSQAGQVEAYLEVLATRVAEKQNAQLRESTVELARTFGDRPAELLQQIGKLVAHSAIRTSFHPTELLEIIPHMQKLIRDQQETRFLGIDSGFEHFNNLCNGLDTGLIVLAAPPAAGKTTWAWQVACQVAKNAAVPVIFVSMEQSKKELRAKALARLSKLQYRHILRGRLNGLDPGDVGRLLQAATDYATLGQHLTVIEGDEHTTVDAIHEAAAAKMALAGTSRCLVVIDYLQILPARAEDAKRINSQKDRVDLHVSALRRLARDLDSPVLAISAENRAGYDSKKMHVFKESGNIEYSADVAMILSRDATQKPPADASYRLMDLNIVKHRNGERGVVKFKFYAARSEFVETGRGELQEDAD